MGTIHDITELQQTPMESSAKSQSDRIIEILLGQIEALTRQCDLYLNESIANHQEVMAMTDVLHDFTKSFETMQKENLRLTAEVQALRNQVERYQGVDYRQIQTEIMQMLKDAEDEGKRIITEAEEHRTKAYEAEKAAGEILHQAKREHLEQRLKLILPTQDDHEKTNDKP